MLDGERDYRLAQRWRHVPVDSPLTSPLVAGCWRLMTQTGGRPQSISDFIETTLQLGIGTFDLANVYGGYALEGAFGQALRDTGIPREGIQIVTKCGVAPVSSARPDHKVLHYDNSAKHVQFEVEQSLRALGTDYVDILLIHRPDWLTPPAELAAVLSALVESKKVLHVGVSNFSVPQMEALKSHLQIPLVANQIEFSLVKHDPIGSGVFEFCQSQGIRPMAWSPLGAGRVLSESADRPALASALEELGRSYGVSAAAIALAWVLRHPAGVVPVIGSGRVERIRAACGALNISLERQDWYRLFQAAGGEVQ